MEGILVGSHFTVIPREGILVGSHFTIIPREGILVGSQLIFPEAVSTGHSIYNSYVIGDHV